MTLGRGIRSTTSAAQQDHDEVYRLIMAGWGSQVVRSRQLGDLIVFGRDKSNDDKPRDGDNATTCKFGRMTLPAYGGAHADWTRSHRRRRNLFAERGTQALRRPLGSCT
jgi:hypothetical protein